MGSLAIGFSGNSIRLIGLSEKREMAHISEIETDFDFDKEVPDHHSDEHLISELASVICENLNKIDNISSYKACLAVNSLQVFSNVIPLEMEAEEQVVSSNILWDLSMYFPQDYENFNVNYYKLDRVYPDENIFNVLVLGINRDIVNFYKNIFEECGLDLHIFDSDHLAVSGLVNEFSPEQNSFISLGLKPGRLDISCNEGDILTYYNFASTGEFDFKRELDNEFRTLEMKDDFNDIKNIYIYGESLLESVKEYLEQKYPDKTVVILDPFNSYTADGSSESILHFSSAARFAPLFGLALKGFR